MDRDEIYKVHGTNRENAELMQREIREMDPTEREVLGMKTPEEMLTQIEAVGVAYSTKITAGEPIDVSGTNLIIKLAGYLRARL